MIYTFAAFGLFIWVIASTAPVRFAHDFRGMSRHEMEAGVLGDGVVGKGNGTGDRFPRRPPSTGPEAWSPTAERNFRANCRRLPEHDLRGNGWLMGPSPTEWLQIKINERVRSAEIRESPERMRVVFHLMILRACYLEEMARRDYHRNWFGHTFDGPSAILGNGFSNNYDSALRELEEQRKELEALFLRKR